MLNKYSGFAANAVLSALIGLVVGLLLTALPDSPLDSKITIIINSAGIGLLIGIASRFSSCVVHQCGLKSHLWTYTLTFLITLSGCIVMAYPIRSSKWQLLISLLIAEPLALMAAYLNIRYTVSLNDSLKRKQAQLQQDEQK